MQPVTLCITSPFAPPEPGSQLVVFADEKNYTAEYDSPKLISRAAKYARKYGVYLVPQRFIVEDYLCMCLLGPDGAPLGVQRAIYLNLTYRGVFHRWDRQTVIQTPFGGVYLAVDVDINYPQVVRSAVGAGAQLIVASQFIQLFDFFEERVRFGCVSAALSGGVPVASATNAGSGVVQPDGSFACGFSEVLPLCCTLHLPQTPATLPAIRRGSQLLRAQGPGLWQV